MAKPLTVKALENLKPAGRRREVSDGGMPGLYFVIQPSGKQSWAYRYRFNGRPRKWTIGPCPAIDLKTARELALAKADLAAGRLVGSLAGEVAESRKRLAMAEAQAGIVAANKAASEDAAQGLCGDAVKWFEVRTPENRLVRHRAASLAALRRSLLPGYMITAEVFGASGEGQGGFAASIGPGAPSFMASLLESYGDELIAFLAERGIKAA